MELYLNEKSLAHEDTILICLQIIWYVNVYSVHVLCQEVIEPVIQRKTDGTDMHTQSSSDLTSH